MGTDHKGQKELSGVMEMVCVLIMVLVTQLDLFVRIHRTAHLMCYFFVGTSYLDKSDLKSKRSGPGD